MHIKSRCTYMHFSAWTLVVHRFHHFLSRLHLIKDGFISKIKEERRVSEHSSLKAREKPHRLTLNEWE